MGAPFVESGWGWGGEIIEILALINGTGFSLNPPAKEDSQAGGRITAGQEGSYKTGGLISDWKSHT